MKISKWLKVFIVLLLQLFVLFTNCFAEYRFPKPEFTSEYQIPITTEPHSLLTTNPIFALILLCFVLMLTVILLYKFRSRFWLRILIIASLFYFGFYHGGCICSVGSIQNIFQTLFNKNVYIPSTVIAVFFLPLLTAVFFGRIFCGAACPLGAIQELFIIRPIKVPHMIDSILKLFPYIYLGIAVVFASCNMGYIICKYDFFVSFFRFSGNTSILVAGGVILLIGTVVARPYCRYICPYSVLLRFMSKFSAQKVSITPDNCIVCHLCKDSCPVGAIHPPKPTHFPESKELALNRLRWIAVMTPILLLLGIMFGMALYKPLSHMHPEIKIVRKLESLRTSVIKERDIYNRDITDAEAFLEKGGNTDTLIQSAMKSQKKLKIALIFFGIYLVLVFIGVLIKATKRRTNTEYVVDSCECIACARCYQSCPRQNKIKGLL